MKEIMEKEDLSVRKVAYLTGVPKSTIADIRTGKTIPKIDTLVKIAAGLNIEITDLYEE